MKISFLTLLIGLITLPLSAQIWQPDFATAQQVAAEKEQNIVLVFSGSDWCAPCIKLDREIWTQETFAAAAGDDFVFYKADFPRRKANKLDEKVAERNAALAEKYNTVGSFPLVVILSPEGDLLGQTGYKKVSPVEYAELLKSFME